MKILVTGGAGYIGSVCVEELLNRGHEAIVIDNLSEGHRAAVDGRAWFFQDDLGNRDRLFDILRETRPDGVIHLAGRALVSESMRDPSIYYRVNVSCGIHLLDAMLDVGCKKLVFSSSCATYGLPERIPIDERMPQNPINPYGHSKLLFEQILKWYERIHGMTPAILRYFNVAGASQHFGEHHRIETHLIPNALKVALGQAEHAVIYGSEYPTPDRTCIRDYIHVLDIASAHILALERSASGAYNLGTGDGYSVLQVIEAARKITGHPIPVIDKPARPGDPPRLVANPSKAKKELGWHPRHAKLTDMISSAWRWHQAHPHGYAN